MVAVAAITVVIAAPACAQTVPGAAQRVQLEAVDGGYGYTDDRCGLLADDTVAEILAADHVVRAYYGPVCQYVLMRGEQTLDATYSWFESGSLTRERRLATDRGAQVSDTTMQRHEGFRARRDTTGAACSATAGAGGGVLSWWVQVRAEPQTRPGGDPCESAEKLLSATLSAAM